MVKYIRLGKAKAYKAQNLLFDGVYRHPTTLQPLNFGVIHQVDKEKGDAKRSTADFSCTSKMFKEAMANKTSLNMLFSKSDTRVKYPLQKELVSKTALFEHLITNYHPHYEPIISTLDYSDGYATVMVRPSDHHLQAFRFDDVIVICFFNMQGTSSASANFCVVVENLIGALINSFPETFVLRIPKAHLPPPPFVLPQVD